MSEQKVWTLLYQHKHGTEVSVYASKRGAQLAAMGLILDFLEDFTGHDDEASEEVRTLVERKDWAGVTARLAKCESTEYIELNETVLFQDDECEKYVELLVKEL